MAEQEALPLICTGRLSVFTVGEGTPPGVGMETLRVYFVPVTLACTSPQPRRWSYFTPIS